MTAHAPGVLAHGAESSFLSGRLPSAACLVMLSGYVVLDLTGRRRHQRSWRSLSFVVGCLLMAGWLSPPFDAAADDDFGVHMAQHLIVAMVAPTFLVLGAPITVLLGGLPVKQARRVTRLLRTTAVRSLTHPVTALVLSVGGMLVLYFTPLYVITTRNETAHALVHLHLVAAGCLFAWVIAGVDPAPRRADVPVRLVVLGIAVAIHATAAQLMFAGIFVQVHQPVSEMRAAGNLMYFGGDIAELLLAVALLATWRPSRSRRWSPQSPRPSTLTLRFVRAVADRRQT